MKRNIYFISGWILLAVGMIGVVFPILPTTPFVILAALCFGKSSPKYYQWLCKTRLFGEYIENFKTKKGISIKTKVNSIFWLWLMIIVAIITNQSTLLAFLLIVVALIVSAHILLLKNKCKVEILR